MSALGLNLQDPLGFGAGGVEAPPSSFRFPSEVEYLQGVIDGVASVVPDIAKQTNAGGVLSAPIASQAAMLVATFENTTGMPMGELAGLAASVVSLAQATTPAEIVSAVGGLVDGALDIAVTIAKAAGVAAGAVKAIPMIGALVGGILDFVVGALEAAAQKQAQIENCKNDARGIMDATCELLVSQSQPRPTGPSGSTHPADIFRLLAYEYQRGSQRYPANLSTMYLMLCGGETQGFGLSRPMYEKRLAEYRKSSGKPNIGIPQQTQRKMWRLIQGLMASINDPRIGVTPRGDGGRSLYPILQEIVRNEWLKGRSPDGTENPQKVVLDEEFLALLGSPFIWTEKKFPQCDPYFSQTCSNRINLGPSMKETIGRFDKALRWKFEEDENGQLTTRMRNGMALPDDLGGGELKLPPARGVMTLSPMQAKLVANVGKGQPDWLSRNAPGLATGAASGLAAFLLGKSYAFDPLR